MEIKRSKVYSVDEIRNKVIPFARKYGIKTVWLFGSYARGDADSDSDVDIVIDCGKLTGMLKYLAFVYDLESTFRCHVDVVSSNITDKAFLSSIASEEVLLYEE